MIGNNKSTIYFNFHGEYASISSDWGELLKFVEKDFFSFIVKGEVAQRKKGFHLNVVRGEAPEKLIPEIQSSMQSLSALSYDVGDWRYCDYYGQLISAINFKRNEAVIYSTKLEKTHEVVYLLLLSRVGKSLDIKGLHKLHAFAISYKETAVVCMMPMKGGKSTLLMELLKDSRIKMISDDIPLVDRFGCVRGFPLKIGLSSPPDEIFIVDRDENLYSMNREQYGRKQLLCVKGIPQKVENQLRVFNKVVLIEAFRVHSNHSHLSVMLWWKSFKGLFKHGIIGIGLPMVMEYFWEKGWKDFFVKAFIFFSRLFSFTILSFRATKLRLHLGKKPEKAAREILHYLEKTYVD